MAMGIIEVKSTVGTVFLNPHSSLLVIDGKRVRKIQAKDVKAGMKVIAYKDVLAELTVDDVHADLMAATNDGARKYQEAHRTLHESCACSVGPIHETTLLRFRLWEAFHHSPLAPDSLRNLDPIQFHQKLYKFYKSDFEKDCYDGIEVFLSEKLQVTLNPTSRQNIHHWLSGDVILPRKAAVLRLIGRFVDDDAIEHMADKRWDFDGRDANQYGLKEVADFYRGRRSALMSYVSKMKAIGGGGGKGGWKAKKDIDSMTDEIETVLENHIDQISGQLISSRIYEVGTVDTPHDAQHYLEVEVKTKELSLSKSVLKPTAERPDDLKSEVDSLGFTTEGLEFETWENEKLKTDTMRHAEVEKKAREERAKEKIAENLIDQNLLKWFEAQIHFTVPCLKVCSDLDEALKAKRNEKGNISFTEHYAVSHTSPASATAIIREFVTIFGYDEDRFRESMKMQLTAYWNTVKVETWNLRDELAVYENSALHPFYRLEMFKKMYETSPYLRMAFHKFEQWFRFIMANEFQESLHQRKNTKERMMKERIDGVAISECFENCLGMIMDVYGLVKKADKNNWGEQCKLYAQKLPPIFWLSGLNYGDRLTRRQKDKLSQSVRHDHGINFNYGIVESNESEDTIEVGGNYLVLDLKVDKNKKI